MHRLLPVLVALAACGSEPTPPVAPVAPEAPQPAAEPPLTVARATPAALPSDDPTLADHYLVILASKLDPAEVTPALDAVRALGALGAKARTLYSSRFKGLMPCYHVAIADASTDRKAAFALAKKLSAAGVDNYVKTAGAYVGPSPTLDAFCAGMAAGEAEATDARLVALAGGRAWVPTGGSVPDGLPDPVALGEDYAEWLQPMEGGGEGQAWTALEIGSGDTVACGERGQAALTLGTPHFGVLQGEGPPSSPACGSAEVYAELDCDLPVGQWLAVPADGPKPVAFAGGDAAPTLEAEAKAALARVEGWTSYEAAEGGELARTVRVARYSGGGATFHVVEGTIEDGESVCGGDEVAWRAVYAAEGDGLGRRLGPFVEEHFSRLVGLVDIEGDGAPELVTDAFPAESTIWRLDGSPVASRSVAYCDCPC